jgi:anaerobic selenocysteine-containing dehydrogenase
VVDAKARGIKDGDLVRVYSEHGEMILPAYVSSREAPGCVAVHHGAWYKPAELKTQLDPYGVDMRGAPNILLHDEYRNDIKAPIITKGLVQVEKFSSVVR